MLRRAFVACFLLLLAGAAIAQTPAVVTSPSNGSTIGGTQAFFWNSPAGAQLYQLWIGSSPGSYDVGYFPASGTTANTVTVENLPTDSRTLHARLWTAIGGTWYFTDATFAASPPGGATITSPTNGATLQSSTQIFQWTAATGATLYQLWIGNSPGAYDIGYYPASGTTQTWWTVPDLPFDGRTLHVRLWSAINGAWVFRDFSYTAAPQGTAAVLVSPAAGATLSGGAAYVVFDYHPVDRGSAYRLWIGSQPGGRDLGEHYSSWSMPSEFRVNGLPQDGRTLYVRLTTTIDGWQNLHRDYTFNAEAPPPPPEPATVTMPQPGAVLEGTSQAFQWNAAAGASYYQLWVGSSPGTYDIGYYPPAGTTQASVTATGLPTDGRTLHVTLWTVFPGQSLSTSATFLAASPAPSPGEIFFPAVGGMIGAPPTPACCLPQGWETQTFRWTPGNGAYGYQLWIGSSPGTFDVGAYPPDDITPNTSITIASGLPTDGRTLHVRLWSATHAGYLHRDYTYVAYQTGDALLRMPTDGPTLPGPANAFGGAAGMGSQQNLRMVIGNSVGSSEFGSGAVGGLQTQFNNLPIDGRALYARQSWTLNGQPRFRDYALAAAPAGPAAVMLSPPNDFGLRSIGNQFTFTFSEVGATQYKIWAGVATGGMEYGEYIAPPGSTSITVTVTPGRVPTSVRLWSLVGGVWYFRDYKYQHFAG